MHCRIHRDVFEACLWPMKAAISMGGIAELMLPADVTDLRKHAAVPAIRNDLASLILISLIKEPSVTSKFVESGCQEAVANPSVSGESVSRRMEDMLDDEALQKMSECTELGRQGVCRFTGCAATFARLGVIAVDQPLPPKKRLRTDPSSSKDRRRSQEHQTSGQDDSGVLLGSSRRRYRKTGDCVKLGPFLEACRANGDAWKSALEQDSIEQAVQRIDAVLKDASDLSSVVPGDASGHMSKFIARKLLLVCVWEGKIRNTCWATITVRDLLPTMPDQTGFLEPIPLDWTC